MDIKEKILSEVQDPKYRPMDIHKWADFLNCKNAESFKELVKAMNEMEENIEIYRNEKDCYLSVQAAGIIVGTLRVNPKGFGFVESETEE